MRRYLFTLLCICLLSTGAFAQTSGSPGGLVVFETFGSTNATNLTQATVLAGVISNDTVLFANSNTQLSENVGIAIVNPNAVTANVTLTLRNGVDGSNAGVAKLALSPHQQVSQFVSQLFPSVPATGFTGTLTALSDNPVAITALRFRGGNFSTIPITTPPNSSQGLPPLATGVGGPTAVILPQFAAGGIWSSSLVISNTAALPITVRVDLFKQDGTPLTTVFNGQSGSSFQNIVIPSLGVFVDTNNDPNPLQVGYAVVTPLDVIPPTVTAVFPVNGANAAAVQTVVQATFSKAMIPTTLNASTFTLQPAAAGLITYSGNTVTFTPTNNLSASTTYTATITTGALDSIAGIPLASNFVWSFTTAAAQSGAPPATPPPSTPGSLTVTSTTPVNLATGVAPNATVAATFSETTMNPATIGPLTFLLTSPGSVPVTGTVGYNAVTNLATFTPAALLALNTTYTATLTSSVQDLAGNPLTPLTWTFTTVTSAPAGPASVPLGAAGPYGILAYSAITLTPSTTINGSLGITNGTSTGLTGCTAGCVVNGSEDFSNSNTAAAKTALVTAYNAAVAEAGPSIALTGGFDLSSLGTIGSPLAPGLYISGSSLQVGVGEKLYLSSADPNATWVFQMPSSTLLMDTSSQIVLQGAAKAANIFWQVGSSATLNDGVTFFGNILANTSITVGGNSVVNGRLLAGEIGSAGAVSVGINSVVTVPAP